MKQKKGFIIQVFLSLGIVSASLFSYLEKQNELTELRIYVPKLVKEIKSIQEDNTRLRYQIQEFEGPEHLMQLAADTKFHHLKYPLAKEVLVLQGSFEVESSMIEKNENSLSKFKHTLAVGAK
jgi:hypothetical protein